MERVGKMANQVANFVEISWIDILPIDYHPGGAGGTQSGEDTLEETLLPRAIRVRKILDRFWSPGVARKICQQRHERDPAGADEFRETIIGVDLEIAHAVYDRHPFGTKMCDLPGMLFERLVTVRIAVVVEREMHLTRGLPRYNRRRRWFLVRLASVEEFFPEGNLWRHRFRC